MNKSIKITLSVYSGRPNPEWIIKEGPEYNRIIELIKNLRSQPEPIFNYNRWNRLGYARFLIEPLEEKDVPRLIHMWRDEAYIVQNNEGAVSYALGALEIYQTLVSQAEDRGHVRFFEKYNREIKRQHQKELLNTIQAIKKQLDNISARLATIEESVNKLSKNDKNN